MRTPPEPPATPVPTDHARVLIAPANFAGQAWQWARAIERTCPPAEARNWTYVTDPTFGFRSDYAASIESVYGAPRAWHTEQFERVVGSFSGVVIEAGRPLFGRLYDFNPVLEAAALEAAGVRAALLWHGSDIRRPGDGPLTSQGSVALRNRRRLEGFRGPVFVSTPDLLRDVPHASWVPVTVDVDAWASPGSVLERDIPVVVHAPSNTRTKGTALIEPIMRRMAERGLVEYRQHVGLRMDQVRAVYHGADIVIDQISLGIYGAAACEAMAAGRLVVSWVDQSVRDLVRRHTGLDLPVAQAGRDELEAVLTTVLADRTRYRALAAQGPSFVRQVHDGSVAARTIANALAPPPTV